MRTEKRNHQRTMKKHYLCRQNLQCSKWKLQTNEKLVFFGVQFALTSFISLTSCRGRQRSAVSDKRLQWLANRQKKTAEKASFWKLRNSISSESIKLHRFEAHPKQFPHRSISFPIKRRHKRKCEILFLATKNASNFQFDKCFKLFRVRI